MPKAPTRSSRPINAVLLIRNNATGAMNMVASGAAGALNLSDSIEAFDGKVEQVFLTLGRFDAIVVAKFADLEGVAAFCLSATAGGQAVEPLLAIDAVNADEVARRAEDAHRRLADLWSPENPEPLDVSDSDG